MKKTTPIREVLFKLRGEKHEGWKVGVRVVGVTVNKTIII